MEKEPLISSATQPGLKRTSILHEFYASLLASQNPLLRYEDVLDHLGAFMVIEPPTPDAMGMERSDMPRLLFAEAERFAPITYIRLTDQYSIAIYTAAAGNPHNFFTAPRELFNQQWRKNIRKYYPHHPATPDLVDPAHRFIQQEGDKDAMPLHHITWTSLVEFQPDEEGEVISAITPVDFYDLVGAKDTIFRQTGITPTALEKIIPNVFTDIIRRQRMSSDTILSIYNTYVVPELNARLQSSLKQFNLNEGPLQIPESFQGFPLRDHLEIAEAIGYNRSIKGGKKYPHGEDGTGGAPQSVPAKHTHTYVHAYLEEIQALFDQLLFHNQNLTNHAQQVLFRHILHVFSTKEEVDYPVLGRLYPEYLPEMQQDAILKHVDPYSTLFAQVMDKWVVQILQEAFQQVKGVTVSSFQEHSTTQDLSQRSIDGWKMEIDIKGMTQSQVDRILRQAYAGVGKTAKKMYDFWADGMIAYQQWQQGDVDQYNKTTDQMQEAHQLPLRIAKRVKAYLQIIHPTDEQIDMWNIARKPGVDVIHIPTDENETGETPDTDTIWTLARQSKASLYNQIFSHQSYTVGEKTVSYNQGFNLPNKPGLAVTIERKPEVIVLYVSASLGYNGLSELITGSRVIRAAPNLGQSKLLAGS